MAFIFYKGRRPFKEGVFITHQISLWRWGSILSKQVPVKNNVLKLLCSIDPACHWSSVGAEMMKQLSNCFPTVIMPSKKDEYDHEVDKYHLCSNFPSSVSKRLGQWWLEVLPSLDYPHLSMLIKSAISIFTGRILDYLHLSMLIKSAMSIFTGPMIVQSFR